MCKYTILFHHRFSIGIRNRSIPLENSSDLDFKKLVHAAHNYFLRMRVLFGCIQSNWHKNGTAALNFSMKATLGERAAYFSSRNDTVCPSASRSFLVSKLKNLVVLYIIQCYIGDLNELSTLLLFILVRN